MAWVDVGHIALLLCIAAGSMWLAHLQWAPLVIAALVLVLANLVVHSWVERKLNHHVVSWLDRLTCRVFGHAWVAHASTGRLSSCIRCVKQHPNAGPEAEPQKKIKNRSKDVNNHEN